MTAAIASRGIKPRRLVLAGGGHAHLAVLEAWIRHAPPATETLLITPHAFSAYSGMVPGWMSGHYRLDELLIDLRPLVKRAGITLLLDEVSGLNVATRTLSLASGQRLTYDLLSLAIGGETDTSCLASLSEHLLPVKPVGEFVARWPGVVRRASKSRHFKLAVVGGGAAGVELAMAAQRALNSATQDAEVCLVAPWPGFLAGHHENVRSRALIELKRRGIALHFATAVGDGETLLLSNGSRLGADCVIAATGSRAPHWLKGSGLKLDDTGYVAIGPDLRSISHREIFAAGDIVSRVDREMARSGVHAVKAGPILATNLRASLAGTPLRRYVPRKRTLYLLATGRKEAILSWGRVSASGRLVWQLKNGIDRRFVKHFVSLAQGWY